MIWSDLIWFDRSTFIYNIYDQAAVSFSYELIDIREKNFVRMRNFKKLHLKIWLMNLMKIKSENRELDENQKMMNRKKSKTWSKLIIRLSLECQFRKHLLTCKKVFHLYDKYAAEWFDLVWVSISENQIDVDLISCRDDVISFRFDSGFYRFEFERIIYRIYIYIECFYIYKMFLYIECFYK